MLSHLMPSWLMAFLSNSMMRTRIITVGFICTELALVKSSTCG